MTDNSIIIVGGGPAGLMAADVLSAAGKSVVLYDAMPSAGRKFLLAGIGGLNITHAESSAQFLQRYGERVTQLTPILTRFDAEAVRRWMSELGIQSFVGSSGRVFPEQMKAAPLLRAWLQRLRAQAVRFEMRQRWLGWDRDGSLIFSGPEGLQRTRTQTLILALGGGSWRKLGSDGAWVDILRQKNILIADLQPCNCGFELNWSEHLRTRHAGQALKSIALSFQDRYGAPHRHSGEAMLTHYGMEGSLIYTCSAALRDLIRHQGYAGIAIDLLPDLPLSRVLEKLSSARGSQSFAHHLKRCTGIKGVKAALLYETLPEAAQKEAMLVAQTLKSLPLRLQATRPLDEAISSAGGVMFEAVDENLMLKQIPGVFCAGEMLDWEAPTGGYLLTACLASGHYVGEQVLHYLSRERAQSRAV